MNRKFDHWIDRGFWAVICGIVMYASGYVKDISLSVSELNTKLTVYITKSDNQAQVILDHENRLRALETLKRK